MSLAESYESAFAARAAGVEPAWLGRRRRRAIESFALSGFPSRRDEAWRFSNLAPLTEKVFPPRAGGSTTPALRALVAAHRIAETTTLVLLNGTLARDLSDALPAGAVTLTAAPEPAAYGEEDSS